MENQSSDSIIFDNIMPPTNLVRAVFYFGYSVLFALAALKILYAPISLDMEVFFLGSIATIAFIIMALIEIYKSRYISMNEKVMWTTGFLFFNFITGIVYFYMGRKRVRKF